MLLQSCMFPVTMGPFSLPPSLFTPLFHGRNLPTLLSKGPSSPPCCSGRPRWVPLDQHGAVMDAHIAEQSHLYTMLSQAHRGAELLSWVCYCCFIPLFQVAGAGFDRALPWQPCIALHRPLAEECGESCRPGKASSHPWGLTA